MQISEIDLLKEEDKIIIEKIFKDFEFEEINWIRFKSFYDHQVCLDGNFNSTELRKIADALDLINKEKDNGTSK